MQVKIAGRSVDLKKSDVIRSGGEAIIFQMGSDKAVKIYHSADIERQRKLQDFSKAGFRLGANVIAPEELVYGKGGIVGFTMRLLPDTYESISMLSNASFSADNHLTPKDKVELFIRMEKELRQIHSQGIVVGDLSDKNEVFDPTKMDLAWLDVDSWQFGDHPCMVGTEAYLSPDLYKTDLSKLPVFRSEHDWYSYCILLFMALVGCHPFKGFHSTFKSLTACAENGMTVFDPGVRYPKVALPPEVLTEELREELVARLKRQKQDEFPLEVLEEYVELLTECQSCGLWYPAREKQCPGCTEKTMLEAKMAVRVAGWNYDEMIKTDGLIVFYQVEGSTLWVVTGENGQNVLYRKRAGEPVERIELFRIRPRAKYGVFDGLLVMCPDPSETEPGLYLLEIENGQVKPSVQTSTAKLAGAKAVWDTSRKYLYRIAGGRILQSERFGASDLAEREVAQAMPLQTWFAVDPESNGREVVIGFYRNFEKSEWFISTQEKGSIGFQRMEINLPELEAGESLNDLSVRFGCETVLILRKTRLNGTDWIRQDVVNVRSGAVSVTRRSRVSDNSLYDYIHGKAYSDDVLMHVTDEGIVKETISSDKKVILPGTEKMLKGAEKLQKYGGGLLMVGNGKVVKLTSGK